MALENAGKELLQAQFDTSVSKVRLKLEFYYGATLDGTGNTSLYDITFASPSAANGLRLATNISIPITITPYDSVKVIGALFTNTDGSTVYADANFTTPFTFSADGEFTLSTATLNFGTTGNEALTTTGEATLLNTLDGDFDNIRIKGLGYVSPSETSPVYSDTVALATSDITRSGSVLSLVTSKEFNITFNPIYTTMEFDTVELLKADGTTLVLTAPLDDTYVYNGNGKFTLTSLQVTLA